MKRTLFLTGFLVVVTACTAAPNEKLPLPHDSPQEKSSTEPVMDYGRLIDSLRLAGVSASPQEAVNQPFFSVVGRNITVNGESVQVFQYAQATVAAEQAALVSPDGNSVGTNMIHWIGSPHFFKKGLLLVLYVGDDEKVRSALEAVLGPQFAGK